MRSLSIVVLEPRQQLSLNPNTSNSHPGLETLSRNPLEPKARNPKPDSFAEPESSEPSKDQEEGRGTEGDRGPSPHERPGLQD